MNKRLSYILILLLACCQTDKAQKLEYDCRLHEGDFNAVEYIEGTPIETIFEDFIQNIDNGAFFISKFLPQSTFHNAVLLRTKGEKIAIIDLNKKREIILHEKSAAKVQELLNNIEKGFFRQACYKGPSEGSLSVLVVKVKARIVLKYEAGQHDYSHLNDGEKVKIKNALALISVLVTTNN